MIARWCATTITFTTGHRRSKWHDCNSSAPLHSKSPMPPIHHKKRVPPERNHVISDLEFRVPLHCLVKKSPFEEGKTIPRFSLQPAGGARDNCFKASAQSADVVFVLPPRWRRRFYFHLRRLPRRRMTRENPINWLMVRHGLVRVRAQRGGHAACRSNANGTVIGTVECANPIRSRKSWKYRCLRERIERRRRGRDSNPR